MMFPVGAERLVADMTRELLNRLPENIRRAVDSLRKDYKNPALNTDAVRKELYGYTKALCDIGFLSERERQILFVYGTV